MNVDHRFTQTQKQYAADDLETMSEAVPVSGARLRPGAAARRRARARGRVRHRHDEPPDRSRSADAALVCIEPNAELRRARASEELDGQPRVAMRICHLEECDRGRAARASASTPSSASTCSSTSKTTSSALRLFRDVVAGTGGKVLIFVPAVQAAYGPLDAALGHHRRYSKRVAGRRVHAAGLDLVTMRYTNPIGLLGWMYNALHQRQHRAHARRQVRLFDTLRRALGAAARAARAAADRPVALRRRPRPHRAA